MTQLTERFEQALTYAFHLHDGQVRKGTQVPYFTHLIGVASLVLEDGGDEDEAIAALLHDAVEDQGGKKTLVEIKQRFGPRVARIVAACSDTDISPKPPWKLRKEQHLAELEHAASDVLRVSLADKIHNVRNILYDYRSSGEVLWSRFRGGKDGTLWYYRSLVALFRRKRGDGLVEEFARVVTELEELSGGKAP